MDQTYEKGKLYDLPIIDLKPDPNQPRKSMDLQALEDLAANESINSLKEALENFTTPPGEGTLA